MAAIASAGGAESSPSIVRGHDKAVIHVEPDVDIVAIGRNEQPRMIRPAQSRRDYNRRGTPGAVIVGLHQLARPVRPIELGGKSITRR